jgi:Na+/proline symporter
MTKAISYCILICTGAVGIVVVVCAPRLLDDRNSFLSDFVNHEYLNVLGVILAITIASSAQIHLTLNGIEEKYKRENVFSETRRGVLAAVHWLIGIFLIAVILVVSKPLLASEGWSAALFNAVALHLLLWTVLLLLSIAQAVFGIRPVIDGD